jgi:hypothetical protein
MRITLKTGYGEQRHYWLIQIRDAAARCNRLFDTADAMIMAQAAVYRNSSLPSDYVLANRQQISDICSTFSDGG